MRISEKKPSHSLCATDATALFSAGVPEKKKNPGVTKAPVKSTSAVRAPITDTDKNSVQKYLSKEGGCLLRK